MALEGTVDSIYDKRKLIMHSRFIVALISALLTLATSARACPYCEGLEETEDHSAVQVPQEPLADIMRAPKLDAEDLAYLLSFENGTRYDRSVDSIIDLTIPDAFDRFLRVSDLYAVLRPRAAIVAKDLRGKARDGRLGPADLQRAAHHLDDLAASHTTEDAAFLKTLADRVRPRLTVAQRAARLD